MTTVNIPTMKEIDLRIKTSVDMLSKDLYKAINKLHTQIIDLNDIIRVLGRK